MDQSERSPERSQSLWTIGAGQARGRLDSDCSGQSEQAQRRHAHQSEWMLGGNQSSWWMGTADSINRVAGAESRVCGGGVHPTSGL